MDRARCIGAGIGHARPGRTRASLRVESTSITRRRILALTYKVTLEILERLYVYTPEIRCRIQPAVRGTLLGWQTMPATHSSNSPLAVVAATEGSYPSVASSLVGTGTHHRSTNVSATSGSRSLCVLRATNWSGFLRIVRWPRIWTTYPSTTELSAAKGGLTTASVG